MLLGESHYRHQIEADIRPFRDILGLFFVSIGMLIDLQLFLSHSLLILGMTLALMLVKGCVVAALVKLRGSDSETAWRSGLALAQGGEFCFALMAQMQQSRLIPDEFNGLLLAATFARCCSPCCCCAPRRPLPCACTASPISKCNWKKSPHSTPSCRAMR
jgi:CPA2 family monovalent cation:H+ antiporter-2